MMRTLEQNLMIIWLFGHPQPSAELKDLTHSFESDVLEQGNIENMQGGVP